MSITNHDRLFENFSLNFPSMAAKTVKWRANSYFDITARLADGTSIIYDDSNETIRAVEEYIYNPSTDDEWKKVISIKLNTVMRVKGVSVAELSDRTGLSRQTLSKYINGHGLPNIQKLAEIAKALRCSITELTEFVRPD